MKPRMPTRVLPFAWLSVLCLFAGTSRAGAQTAAPMNDPDRLPIPRVAADVRGVLPRFKQNPVIAGGIGVTAENLPTHGLGLIVGAHWYPLRMGAITLGVGGEWLVARASRTLDPATAGGEPGPTVDARLSSISPQVSFNFGKQNGWSYVSGGIGRSSYTTERAEAPLPDQESGSKTINYGGGARWFAKPHVAVSVDLRFYAINPQEASALRPAVPRMTLVMISAGVSFK